ncbi:adenosylcobinamide-GDP ribazoletransferase [Devosia sp. XJ19-1]|uniref:Adenosylcobinamide-GDP ribazoletransferase n=1 Tax=Devosia ureilytica TaxID=2952754 RepID=A0A9Q4AQH2_9HYPH|nr:adenosylcobinamide-GDP ribazoletransferase [Devosia ureilytica]MCP8884214.1 adenosylcobinamide-GDP ribazoletransferase [Devosia ureilytica]MCP8887822.1 adenosylcobinamide-GDP ribazoletransferase [Devosia ureilytica]
MTDGAQETSAKDDIAAESRDAYRPEPARGGLGLKDDLVMALRFFSRLPTGDAPHESPDLGRIAMALPFASVIMGIVPILLVGSVWLGLPGYFAAALAVGAMVVVGGGMMEDSLADAADGLFGGATRERRLEILKDSRHGTYGVAALCLFLVLRVTAIGGVAAVNPLAAAALWLAANVAGRSGALWIAVALPPARVDGASATAGMLPASRFAVGALLAALLVFVIGAPASSLLGVVVALLAVGLVALGWAALCRRLVGGQTGDLIGAAAGLSEVAALAILLIFA